MSRSLLEAITLRGLRGSLVWGYRAAATCGAWTVERKRPEDKAGPWEWTLRATLAGSFDAFSLRQRPLLFSAPRKGGFFTWPIRALVVHDSSTPVRITATLSPPEY